MATMIKDVRFLSRESRTSEAGRSLKKFLVAVDDSEYALRAVRYVGSVLCNMQDTSVTLFHVLKPMPRELLEHGGSENPAEEVRLTRDLQREQENWVREESAKQLPILGRAAEWLQRSGFPRERVTLKFGHEDNIARSILDEARTGGFGTIVVSRHGANSKRRFLGAGIMDELLRTAAGVTLWVVD